MRRVHRFAFHVGRVTLHVGRWAWYVSAGLLVAVMLVLVVARVGLPALAEKKIEIENFISEQSDYPVRVGALDTYWEGLRPGLRIKRLEVFSSSDMSRAIKFREVRVSLALLPLIWGEVQIDSLVVVNPKLAIERLADGRLQLTGFEPMATPRKGGGGKLLSWLLRQRELIIEDGELQWFDHKSDEQALYLSNISLNLHNAGDSHQLGVTARFPPELCGQCSLIIDIVGDPLVPEELSGTVFLKAIDMNLGRLPKIARDALPATLAGEFDLQLWSTWRGGKLQSARGDVEVSQLRLPLKRLGTAIAFREARTRLSWKKRGKYWELSLTDLWLGLSGPAWSAGRVRVAHGPSGSTAHVSHINIEDVAAFVTGISGKRTFAQNLKMIRPGGDLYDIELTVDGKGSNLDDYSVTARLEGFRSEPLRKIPGVRGLSGQLSARGLRGTFLLDAKDMVVTAPHNFRAPISTNTVFARLAWEIKSDHVEIVGKDLRVSAEDGNGTGTLELRIPFDKTLKPDVDVQVEFSDGNGAHSSRYVPINLLGDEMIAWLDSSIVAGRVVKGSLVYQGNVADFPFREGNGRFEVQLEVRDGVFNYLPGWTPITDAEVHVQFKGSQMRVTQDRGRLGRLDLGKITVTAEDLRKNGKPIIKVAATASGAVVEAMRILRESPVTEGGGSWRSYLGLGFGIGGQGTINLRLSIPARNASAFEMDGEYVVEDGSLAFRVPRIRADRINGRVEFDLAGPTQGELKGRILGGAATVQIMGQDKGERNETVLSGRGRFTDAGLFEAFQWRLGHYLQGSAAWTGTMRLRPGYDILQLEADLSDMQSTLPAPLNKPKGQSQKLALVSERIGRGRRRVDVGVGEIIDARFEFNEQEQGWDFTRGTIGLGVGAVKLPAGPGLSVFARADHVDADPWFQVLERKDGPLFPDFLRRLRGDFQSVFLFNRRFGRLRVEIDKKQDAWRGRIVGDSVDGRIGITETAARNLRLDLDLERLVVPEQIPDAPKITGDPHALPLFALKARSFQYKDKEIGALDFWAVPIDQGWRVVRANMTRPGTELSLSGNWTRAGEAQRSDLRLRLRSSNLGETLQELGYPQQIENGQIDLSASLTWQGSPLDPAMATLDGDIQLSAKNGRLLQITSGAGQFIEFLDIASFGKWGKGMPFKTIGGDITIENGNAYTQNLYTKHSTFQLFINGRVGIAAKDFDLAVQVIPKLGTNILLWGTLPIVGVTLLALEKVLDKPLAGKTGITYTIKGPWKEPTIGTLGQIELDRELEELRTGGN